MRNIKSKLFLLIAWQCTSLIPAEPVVCSTGLSCYKTQPKVNIIYKMVPQPVRIEQEIPVPIEKPVPYPVAVLVPQPYPINKNVYVPYKVYVKERVPIIKRYPVERKVRVPVHVPVDVPVEVKVLVPQPVRQEKVVYFKVPVPEPVPYPVVQEIPVPAKPYPIENNKATDPLSVEEEEHQLADDSKLVDVVKSEPVNDEEHAQESAKLEVTNNKNKTEITNDENDNNELDKTSTDKSTNAVAEPQTNNRTVEERGTAQVNVKQQ